MASAQGAQQRRRSRVPSDSSAGELSAAVRYGLLPNEARRLLASPLFAADPLASQRDARLAAIRAAAAGSSSPSASAANVRRRGSTASTTSTAGDEQPHTDAQLGRFLPPLPPPHATAAAAAAVASAAGISAGAPTIAREAAALEIQRAWKGFWTRRRLADITAAPAGSLRSEAGAMSHVDRQAPPPKSVLRFARRYAQWTRRPPPVALAAATTLAKAPVSAREQPPGAVTAEEAAAVRMQAWWRGVLSRRRTGRVARRVAPAAQHLTVASARTSRGSRHRPPSQSRSLASVQLSSSGGVRSIQVQIPSSTQPAADEPTAASAAVAREVERRARAAACIQRAFRQFMDRRIFRFYRDLVNFRLRGDNLTLLRSINPREASLAADAAGGFHIRFRLGGSAFPPRLYYKVFTHRPVCDLGAFAPRNYAAPESKQELPITLHRQRMPDYHGPLEQALTDRRGWYHRVENNTWRSVDRRVIEDAMEGERPRGMDAALASAQESAASVCVPTRLARRDDVERRRKVKRVLWMKKLYGLGDASREQADAHEGAPAELLEWSESLDFDAYLADWSTLAVSEPSDARVSTFGD
jgi:hypothetical protein